MCPFWFLSLDLARLFIWVAPGTSLERLPSFRRQNRHAPKKLAENENFSTTSSTLKWAVAKRKIVSKSLHLESPDSFFEACYSSRQNILG